MSLFIIILGLLPGFAWLFFFLEEDTDKEPPRLIISTFLLGASFALFAFAVQMILLRLGVPDLKHYNLASRGAGIIVSLLLFALVEEVFKFAAAFVHVRNKEAFDIPVDAMIYTIVAALGFATLENLGAISPEPGKTAMVGAIFETASFRFVGATLLHALTSGLVGYYWAIGIRHFKSNSFIFLGLGLATILHAAFNYLILANETVAYSVAFLLIVGFFILNDFEKLKERMV